MKIPQQTPTGETFVMCTPKDWLTELVVPAKRREQGYYDTLRDTIRACGGTVIEDRAVRPQHFSERLGTYPRDVGIVLPRDGEPVLYTPEQHGTASRMETIRLALLAEKKKLATQETIPGRVEGGNLVYDPTRHALFVGVTNHEHVKAYHNRYPRYAEDAQGRRRRIDYDPIENVTDEQRQHYLQDRIRHARPTREWLDAARAQLPALPTGEGDRPLRIVPLFIPDQHVDRFYHLDGVFNVLPTGQAIACPSILSKAARHRMEQVIGKENIIPVSEEEAQRGATNFITVGRHVITPYASDALKETLAGLGYDVIDPPAVGLPSGAWRFNDGAFVRCATLKMTPDKGFPDAEKNRGAEAAVSLPYRS